MLAYCILALGGVCVCVCRTANSKCRMCSLSAEPSSLPQNDRGATILLKVWEHSVSTVGRIDSTWRTQARSSHQSFPKPREYCEKVKNGHCGGYTAIADKTTTCFTGMPYWFAWDRVLATPSPIQLPANTCCRQQILAQVNSWHRCGTAGRSLLWLLQAFRGKKQRMKDPPRHSNQHIFLK